MSNKCSICKCEILNGVIAAVLQKPEGCLCKVPSPEKEKIYENEWNKDVILDKETEERLNGWNKNLTCGMTKAEWETFYLQEDLARKFGEFIRSEKKTR